MRRRGEGRRGEGGELMVERGEGWWRRGEAVSGGEERRDEQQRWWYGGGAARGLYKRSLKRMR